MLNYRKILPVDYELILKWYQKYLNSGEYIENTLSHDVVNPEYLGFILENNKECIGIISAKPSISFTYPKIQLEQEIVDYIGSRRIFTLDIIVIEEKFRGQHLSSFLGKLLIDALKDIGVELLLVEFWVMPDGNIPADGFLRKFTKQVYSKKIPMFYEELSHYNMTCPICGDHCICGAEVLVLEFS
jgi:GNAT superfamily N-acetyltransferase